MFICVLGLSGLFGGNSWLSLAILCHLLFVPFIFVFSSFQSCPGKCACFKTSVLRGLDHVLLADAVGKSVGKK